MSSKKEELEVAILLAKAAIVGDSSDAEYDSLVRLIKVLKGEAVPECTCENDCGHDFTCPQSAWELQLPPKEPCPFCGSTKVNLEADKDDDGTRYAFVRCDDCGADGSLVDEDVSETYKTDAIVKWNKRAAK